MGSLFDDMMEDHAKEMRGNKPKKKFIVYINQVNQTYVEVEASDEEEARAKGYRKWRTEHAHSTISCVEEVK